MGVGEDRALQEAARGHLLQHFARNGAFGPDDTPLPVLVEADGLELRDSQGRWWLDGLSSLFCSQLGHGFGEEFAAAASAQLRRLPFTTNWGIASDTTVHLAERLCALAPPGLEHAFFTSGGSESVEAAWKLVRSFHRANGEPERDVVIARRIAYHGATLGALSFTGVESIKAPFGRPAVETHHVSHTGRHRVPAAADGEAAFCAALLAEVEETVRRVGPGRVAMLIAEPIQNGGGCFVPPEGYWPGLRELADRHGFLLVADEVIAGFGRLGEWFGGTRYGAAPDLVTVAKGLTSAYAPMGAVLAHARVAEHLYAPGVVLPHGVTFGGHPVSAAIALRNIEVFEREGVLEGARSRFAHLEREMRRLEELDVVSDVRGDGFFWAAELRADTPDGRLEGAHKTRVVKEVLPRELARVGLIARPDDRGEAVVQIAPPLVASDEQLGEVVDRLADAIGGAREEIRDPGAVRAAA